MTYTNNTPQSTQTIAFTQPLIFNNFAFIENSIRQEHNFDSTDATLTYHLKASMPNQALSPALPAGTNGVYFVNSGAAYFYDATNNWRLSTWQNFLTGTYTATSSTIFNTIDTLPANVQGIISLVNATGQYGQLGTFLTDGTRCYGVSCRMKINGSSADYPIELDNASATLALGGRRFDSNYSGPYTYKIFYRPL